MWSNSRAYSYGQLEIWTQVVPGLYAQVVDQLHQFFAQTSINGIAKNRLRFYNDNCEKVCTFFKTANNCLIKTSFFNAETS